MMRRFDLLQHILVTHVCDLTQIPAEGSGCRWGGGAVGIPDHDSWWDRGEGVREGGRGGREALLFDVNGLLDFMPVPLMFSA